MTDVVPSEEPVSFGPAAAPSSQVAPSPDDPPFELQVDLGSPGLVPAGELREPQALADAEVIARHAGVLNWWVAEVMAEYDRRARLLDEAVGTLKRLNPIMEVARGLAEDWFDSRLGDMVNLDGTRDELFAELATLFGYSNGRAPSDD